MGRITRYPKAGTTKLASKSKAKAEKPKTITTHARRRSTRKSSSESNQSDNSSSSVQAKNIEEELARLAEEAKERTLFRKDRAILEVVQTPVQTYLHKLEKKRLESEWMKSGEYGIPDWQMNEIFKNFYLWQGAFKLTPYMEKQEAVNAKMRSILIDWLAEVHHKFKLQPVTLWLAVNILDRYLEKEPNVPRAKLQLVGVTGLFVACKCYNKDNVPYPGVRESVYITDKAYKEEEVRDTEAKILKRLDFQVYVPTGYQFLERYLNIIDAEELVQHLAWFYAERNLQEYDSLELPSHHMAAAALYAALVYVNQFGGKARVCQPTWPPSLVRESGLSESKLISAARQLLMHVNESPQTSKNRKLNAIWKKYVSERYLNVSQLPLPSI